jgi:hypothetical protein
VVWDVANGVVTPLASFFAYNPAFTGGVFVACGDVNGDGRPDVVTGAGAGGGPHVRAFTFSGATPIEIATFFAYDAAFTGGVRVAAADVDGNGVADIITGAGPGGGPHVRAFDVTSENPREIVSFFAYEPGFAGGVFVAGGDVSGDGRAEIITGTYQLGGPVRVFDVAPTGVTERGAFFAYFDQFLGPVHVGAADITGDGVAEILTGAGPFGGPHIRAFNVAGGAVTEAASFYAYEPLFCDFGVLFPGVEICDGVYVGAADVNGDGRAEIVTGTNRHAGPLKVFQIGAGVAEVIAFFPYFERFIGPVHVSALTPGHGLMKSGPEIVLSRALTHSMRSASVGAMRVPRRAGMNDASVATAISTSAVAPNVRGSSGSVWNSSVPRSLVNAAAAIRPPTIP